MTALNFALTEDGVFVVVDTLVSVRGFKPGFFTAKVHYVPHLNALVCGTGSLAFTLDWYRDLLGGIHGPDVSFLDIIAPNRLRKLYRSRRKDGRQNLVSTIYHLGFDDRQDRFVGFAYNSENGFRSEPLAYGTMIKPGYPDPRRLKVFPEDFIDACRKQRAVQDQQQPHERIFIGGQVIAYAMQVERAEGEPSAVVATITRPFEFEDFQQTFLECARAAAGN